MGHGDAGVLSGDLALPNQWPLTLRCVASLHATGHEGTEVVVAATMNSEDELTIRVDDEGIGIPEEFRSRVFNKFFSISNTKGTRRDSRGLGMGLAIARAIVEAHGGRIWIEERSGRGTSVLFTLPAPPLTSSNILEVASA